MIFSQAVVWVRSLPRPRGRQDDLDCSGFQQQGDMRGADWSELSRTPGLGG